MTSCNNPLWWGGGAAHLKKMDGNQKTASSTNAQITKMQKQTHQDALTPVTVAFNNVAKGHNLVNASSWYAPQNGLFHLQQDNTTVACNNFAKGNNLVNMHEHHNQSWFGNSSCQTMTSWASETQKGGRTCFPPATEAYRLPMFESEVNQVAELCPLHAHAYWPGCYLLQNYSMQQLCFIAEGSRIPCNSSACNGEKQNCILRNGKKKCIPTNA